MSPESRGRRCLAEAIGTFCLVFAGTGAVVVNDVTRGAVGGLGIALTFGLIVLAMIYAVGHVSGAHLNPAVTTAFWAAGRLRGADVLPYAASQCLGAVAASGSLRLLFWGRETRLGLTVPAGSVCQSLALETLLTAMLMFVIMAVATDDKAEGQMAGIAVGAVVALEAAFGGPISGASMNPARSLGPAVVVADFHSHWAYWAGPMIGALCGARLYELVRADPRAERHAAPASLGRGA